jgi:hypothetical protein
MSFGQDYSFASMSSGQDYSFAEGQRLWCGKHWLGQQSTSGPAAPIN